MTSRCSRKMLYNLWEHHVRSMYTVLMVFASVKGQSLDIVTSQCERNLGSEIQLRGSFPAQPVDPVTWLRQDGSPITNCEPNVACDPPVTGYLPTQSNSGLTYTLTISSARTIDSGIWSLSDPSTTYTRNLVFAPNLQGIQVTCSAGTQTGDDFQITDGLPSPLTCATECTSDTVSLECFLEKDGTTTLFTSNTGPSACSGGNTWSSSITLTSCVSGTYAIICQLTAGSCSYNDTGKNITCSELSTTSMATTELSSVTSLTTDVTNTDTVTSTDTVTAESYSITSVSDTVSNGDTTTTQSPTSTDDTTTDSNGFGSSNATRVVSTTSADTTAEPTTTGGSNSSQRFAPCTGDKSICNVVPSIVWLPTWIPKIIYEEDVCIASDGVQIALLVLGVFILVAGIVLLVVTVKKIENGGCKQKLVGLGSVVIATSGISVILFIVVLAVEVATVSETSCLVENCPSESENAARNCRALEIAGFIFFGLAFSLLVIQMAAFVYEKQRICQAQPRDAANGAKPKKDKPNGLELSSR